MKRGWMLFFGLMVLLFATACGADDNQGDSGDEGAEETMKEEETSSENEETEEDVIKKAVNDLAMHSEIKAENDRVTFQFSLENQGDEAYELGFTSGQKYEIVVKNDSDEEVYRFSEGQMFTQALETKTLEPGDSMSFEEEWSDGVEPGDYNAAISIEANSVNSQTLESKPFQETKAFTVEGDKPSGDDSDGPAEGEAFRNVEVSGKNGSYVITGEAKLFEGSFIYNVEDGHNMLIENTTHEVDEAAPSWSSFELEIDIAEDQLPENGTLTLTLFEIDPKSGNPTNVNYIPLEQFQG
ncbi:hypothetical protein GCM10007216_01240 [Thalassobacillus devorans]|uniref:Immunoglobulin-like domain of spore germination n=1 Tax=Thalassobacillus devorans TaxID=279813 RepID=A0ABQ1NEA0_9BACI|nr:BsuPI-related putative proteinase inhibitor [Thalassobacillus devorans]NIK27032.1 hypothetical protein [Thalassobacillus devorans]GGC74387.1 hypothetical protein GCM10007216_01240 [Thalassobacillus devorans]